jgi:hypothetical protein
VRQRGADQQERRLDHQHLHGAKARGVELGDRRDGLNAGVVHQNVGLEAQRLQGRHVEKVHCPGGSIDVGGQ